MLRSFEKTQARVFSANPDVAALERIAARRRLARRAARVVIQSLAFVSLVLLFFFRIPGVEGRSMQPNINNGNHVLISTLAYQFRIGPLALRSRPIERGDVIAFERGEGDERRILLKRVIALPGESVALSDGTVLVNGKALRDDYEKLADRSSTPKVSVPAGSYFVLGDNRAESDDSRAFGSVVQSAVIGKAVMVIWPLADVKQIR